MRKFIVLPSVGIMALAGQAQERIDTDRPDQTESALTVPKKYFQGEFGLGREAYKTGSYTLIHPAFLFKYGLGKIIELRLEGNYSSQYFHFIPQTRKETVFEPLEIGTKVALWEEKAILPKTSVIVHLGLPFTSNHFDRNQSIYPSVRFTFQHTISTVVGLGYNAGAEWDGYSSTPIWIYTLSPNFNIGKRWYAYAEVFGSLGRHFMNQHAIDGGLAYYITNNTKMDLSGGFGIDDNLLRNYLALGFSFRVPTSR